MSSASSLCPALAVFGTASDVGKSLVTAGLCRIVSDAGIRVAPFKAQNMSNNSGVTQEGGEMGRAQIVQAWAARVAPHVDMNPVLLKPGGEDASQVVVLGRPWKNRDAKTYFRETPALAKVAFGALRRLREQYECVVLEGAGSCAEVNLRSREFVNFPAAHEADARVVLVADIERGGVFAQIIGSLEVMPPEDRKRVVGFVVNRFRGDQELFADGVRYIEERTGLPIFGVVPFVHQMGIDSEDSLRLDAHLDPPDFADPHAKIRIAVLRFPHISNATDFDALIGLEGVELHFLSRPRSLGPYDLLLLPGSKNVRTDLRWMQDLGWQSEIATFSERGGRVGGICGGYQMMGSFVADPDGVEGEPGESRGLGLLPTRTTLGPEKVLGNVRGTWDRHGVEVHGYEIHMGRSEPVGPKGDFLPAVSRLASTVARDDIPGAGRTDGLMRHDGKVWGTYLHGLFDSPDFLRQLLSEMHPCEDWDLKRAIEERSVLRERSLVAWADHLRVHLDLERLFTAVGLEK